MAGELRGEGLEVTLTTDAALTALDRGPMNAEESAWMKRVGAHVSAHAKPGFNPISMMDRIIGRITGAREGSFGS